MLRLAGWLEGSREIRVEGMDIDLNTDKFNLFNRTSHKFSEKVNEFRLEMMELEVDDQWDTRFFRWCRKRSVRDFKPGRTNSFWKCVELSEEADS